MLQLMTYLALTIPGADGSPVKVQAPSTIPQGGLGEGEAGNFALKNGITMFLILLTVVALFFLIWGGVKWIMSGGEKSKIDSARKTILYAIIGLVTAFLSFFIINIVGGFFGIAFF